MSLIKSRLQFWLFLFLVLNISSLLLITIKEGALPTEPLYIALGLIFQLPIILIFIIADALIIKLCKNIPRPNVWIFISRFVFLFLFVFIYCASVAMYLGVGVFVSFEVISVFFIDFINFIPLLLTSALIPILLVILLTLSFFIPFHKLTIFSHLSCQRFMIPVFSTWFFLFCLSVVIYLPKIQSDHNVFIGIMKNTLPTTFLLGQYIEKRSDASDELYELKESQLDKQIPLSKYKELAGTLNNKPPVILIMLESISYNHLGFTGYQRKDISPNLDRLFGQSFFFDRAYTSSNHSNLSQGSILSSQYPLRRIRLERFQEINYVKPMLFDILHAYGYETAIYSAQNENWLGMRRFIESNGAKIDHFKHALDFPDYYQFYDKKIDDADLITEIINYLTHIKNPDKPQFLYVNLQRTHYDYQLKPGVKGHFGETHTPLKGTFFDYGEHQVENALLRYDNALHYVDQQIGRFFIELKNQGLFDDALVIVTADHGEAFYENGYATHATSMYDEQIRTFLSIKLPHQKTGVYRSDAISSLDVIPMALEGLGLPNHPAFQGYQLLSRTRTSNEPIFSTGQSVVRGDAIIQYPWKYFMSEKEGAVLINLENDPDEKINLAIKSPNITQNLQSRLSQYRKNQLTYYIESEQSIRDTYYAPKYNFSTSAQPVTIK